jgi:LysR family transcriptional regulator, regulator for bpeEF and oprC
MELDTFRGVVPFVAVVEERSFRRAAIRLGVSAAAVSKAISGLERSLGMILLVRGSREITLTREGEHFFEGARPALTAVTSARAMVEGARKDPAGTLSVTAPYVVASLLPPALTILRARHPRLSYRLMLTDRVARLGEESIDVAIRIGALPSSALIARRLRSTRLVVVASPSYLARAGTPRRPSELAGHDCIALHGPSGKPHAWQFASAAIEVRPRLSLDHAPSLIDALLAGLGVAQVFDFMVEELLRAGRLVALFADEAVDGPHIYALCAPGRRATARVRAAFDAFADALGATAPVK